MIERSIPSQDGREKNSTRQVFSILKNLFYNLYDVGFILSPHQSSEFGQRKTWTALPLPSPSGLLPELFLMWKSQTFCNNQFLKPCNALIAKSCAKFISWLWFYHFSHWICCALFDDKKHCRICIGLKWPIIIKT